MLNCFSAIGNLLIPAYAAGNKTFSSKILFEEYAGKMKSHVLMDGNYFQCSRKKFSFNNRWGNCQQKKFLL